MTDGLSAENLRAASDLGAVMKRLHRHISSKVMSGMQAELADLDLSFSQLAALHLLRASESLSVTQLSERARLSLPATSHLVERLVQRGLAQRSENPENRREKVVQLSPLGLQTLEQMDANFVQAYLDTFAALNPQAVDAATRQLDTLLHELEAVAPSPTEEQP